MTTKLSLANLGGLDRSVARPEYSRADLSPGILHLGVGNFHRAHQAVYLDKLFNLGRDLDWAIVGAGIKRFDDQRRALLKEQDWLTTVVELDPKGYAARVTGAMLDFCQVQPEAIIARLTDPEIRIVSLTITEGGYYIDAQTGGFDATHPEIVQDVDRQAEPETVFGLLTAGLARRRAAGHAPFTILSCDNLPENGHVTRQAVVGYARLVSPALADWIDQKVAFPNSMVDCITPATSEREVAMVVEKFQLSDAAPVACEPFRQWVMEDNFPAGRPALEHVGVEFVQDVAPYETMKLRILNAGHAAIAYPAALLGHGFVHEAMADQDIQNWLLSLVRREVIPVLPPIPGVDFDAYLTTCVTRFANPAIGDTVARLCLDGSNRQPKFVLPTISDALAVGAALDGLALELALWCQYCAQSTATEAGYVLEDPRAADLAAASRDPQAFLQQTEIFGDLGNDPRLATAFADWLRRLQADGARATLRAYING